MKVKQALEDWKSKSYASSSIAYENTSDIDERYETIKQALIKLQQLENLTRTFEVKLDNHQEWVFCDKAILDVVKKYRDILGDLDTGYELKSDLPY